MYCMSQNSERHDDHPDGKSCSSRRVKADPERRRLLVAMGGVGTVAISGCLDMFDDEDDPEEEPEAEDDPDEEDDPEEETEDDPEEETEDDPEEEAQVYEVEFLEFDETIEVNEDEALLYAGLDQGWDLQYACEVGTCGQCTARYDGDANEVISHDGNEFLEEEQIEDGWLLTCVAFPEDNFAIETNVQPEEE